MHEDDLYQSIVNGDPVSILDEFLSDGGDLLYVNPVNGWSFLHLAAEHSNLCWIRKLIEKGVDPNYRAGCNYPAIFQALDGEIDGAIQTNKSVDYSATLLLKELGAGFDELDNEGNGIFEWARRYGGGFEQELRKEFDLI